MFRSALPAASASAFFRALALPVMLALAGGAASGATAVPAPTASLLANGDFESGDLAGWSFGETANGTLGSPGVAVAETVAGRPSHALQLNVGEASQDLEWTAEGGVLTQSFVLGESGDFRLSADLAVQAAPDFGNMDGGSFRLMIDGETVAAHTFGEILPGEIQHGSLLHEGSLSAGVHTLSIQITRFYGSSPMESPLQYIDNVSLTAAVPEPSRMVFSVMGLLALAGLGLARRTRG